MTETIPIFPLNVVLFPGGVLPLKIFEARYLDMVGNCMRNNTGFGVCLIKSGRETGEAASCFEVGTYAEIIDWDQYENGLLGISVKGKQRFRIIGTELQPDNLLLGNISWIENEEEHGLQPEHHELQDIIFELINSRQLPYDPGSKRLNDAVWLGYRLAEILPMDLHSKQKLLENDNPADRLDRLRKFIDQVDDSSLNA